jgi:hypothetical protein
VGEWHSCRSDRSSGEVANQEDDLVAQLLELAQH